MTTFTVTSTSDNAADTGSLRYALMQAQNSPGAVIAFGLPANSTITLLSVLPNPTVAQVYDFSGSPGLTIGGAANIIRDYVGADITGQLTVGPANNSASALLVAGARATAILRGGADISDSSTGNPTILVTNGVSVSLEAGAKVAAASNNAIAVTAGSNQILNIAAGAQVTGNGTTAAAIYIDTSVSGGVVNNAGQVKGVGNAVFLGEAGVLNNTGTLTNTGTSPTVYFSGTSTSITSSGVIAAANSTTAYAIGGNSASGTIGINLQAGSTTTGNVGGNLGVAYTFSLAGALNGAIYGGTANDTLTLNTSATLSGVTAINLGGGTDTLVLDGAGTATLNDARVGNVESLIKNGAGTWTLSGATTFTSVALNGGLLELANAGAVGAAPITFATGVQTLQLDGRTAGGVFEDTLAQLGAGDRVDVRGVGQADSAVVVGNSIQLRSAAGATLYTLNVDSGAAVSALPLSVGPDGAGGTLVSFTSSPGSPTVPSPTTTYPTQPPSTPTPGASQQAGLPIAVSNLIRAGADDASTNDPSSPIYAQSQAGKAISARLDAGQTSLADAQSAIYHLVDGTTSVAEISYAFFTGRTPTAAGLNYLVHSSANATDLNDAYYVQFSTENRYINFANSLATGQGAGAAAFQANYGALSLSDATAKAYQAVFGIAPTADKVSAILTAQVSNGLGGTETRAQYLADITGGSAISQKAAVVGFLLADSVKEGFGAYQQADLHFLQDLAHGTAVFNVDLLAAYTQPPALVGQPVADPTIGG